MTPKTRIASVVGIAGRWLSVISFHGGRSGRAQRSSGGRAKPAPVIMLRPFRDPMGVNGKTRSGRQRARRRADRLPWVIAIPIVLGIAGLCWIGLVILAHEIVLGVMIR